MKNVLKIFLVCLLVISCKGKADEANLTIITEKGELKYNVEQAQTMEELAVGLMDVDTIAEDGGMIFDLSNVQGAAMWMKNTRIPLDMIFIDGQGNIVWIYENAQPMSEDLIISPAEFSYVLELNAGQVAKNNISVGDKVRHSMLGNM